MWTDCQTGSSMLHASEICMQRHCITQHGISVGACRTLQDADTQSNTATLSLLCGVMFAAGQLQHLSCGTACGGAFNDTGYRLPSMQLAAISLCPGLRTLELCMPLDSEVDALIDGVQGLKQLQVSSAVYRA